MHPSSAHQTLSAWYSVQLPWPINYLPSIFRALALIYLIPVLLLVIIDVGGYLLFKLFYKPFGDYPMYCYFKQAPPRESCNLQSSDARHTPPPVGRRTPDITTSSRPLSTSVNPSPSNRIHTLSPDQNFLGPVDHLRMRNPRSQSGSAGFDNGAGDGRFVGHGPIGFEGPMLDFKSPTASDYGEDTSPMIHEDEHSEPTSSN